MMKFLCKSTRLENRAVGGAIFEFCRLVLNEVMPNDCEQVQQLLFIQLLGFASSAPTYKLPSYKCLTYRVPMLGFATLTANLQIPNLPD